MVARETVSCNFNLRACIPNAIALRYVVNAIIDAKASHTIYLSHNGIGAQGARDLAERLEDARIPHTIDLSHNGIGDQGVRDLAEQLKDARIPHTIYLSRNGIGAQGARDLADMMRIAPFPSYIYYDNQTLDVAKNNNDAILALSDPQAFAKKIRDVFGTLLPLLFTKCDSEALRSIITRHPPLMKIIDEYIGTHQRQITLANLVSLREKRINDAKIKFIPNYEDVITVAANYDNVRTVAAKLDKQASVMLIIEHFPQLLPKSLKDGVSEYVSLSHVQYCAKTIAATTISLHWYDKLSTWYMPLVRGGLFIAKDLFIGSLYNNFRAIKGLILEYTDQKMAELIANISFGAVMSVTFACPTITMPIVISKSLSNYLEIEGSDFFKLAGSGIGFASAHAKNASIYEHLARTIGGGYLGEMLEVGAHSLIQFYPQVGEQLSELATTLLDTSSDL